MPKIPKVLCYRFYLLLKKNHCNFVNVRHFKFKLFHTKLSRSLRSLNLGLHLVYKEKKKSCHRLAMKCCIGNNLISSVFKAEILWGKFIHSGQLNLRGILVHMQKTVGRFQGWSPESVVKVTGRHLPG